MGRLLTTRYAGLGPACAPAGACAAACGALVCPAANPTTSAAATVRAVVIFISPPASSRRLVVVQQPAGQHAPDRVCQAQAVVAGDLAGPELAANQLAVRGQRAGGQ